MKILCLAGVLSGSDRDIVRLIYLVNVELNVDFLAISLASDMSIVVVLIFSCQSIYSLF